MTAPSKMLLAFETTRAIFEYCQSLFLTAPLKFISPRGDGHPVIILPGLGTADGSTHFARNFLSGLGYNVHPWGLGRNMGPRRGLEKLTLDIEDRVRSISEAAGGAKVSVIGWSLGGIYARELAKSHPSLVRQVITLGTPFKVRLGATNAQFLYELLSKDKSHLDPAFIDQISLKPPVPFTSIYSKSDGVVSWECSIEEEDEFAENIQVPYASHLGLGHNPITMYLLANRLSQPENNWQRYSKS